MYITFIIMNNFELIILTKYIYYKQLIRLKFTIHFHTAVLDENI